MPCLLHYNYNYVKPDRDGVVTQADVVGSDDVEGQGGKIIDLFVIRGNLCGNIRLLLKCCLLHKSKRFIIANAFMLCS